MIANQRKGDTVYINYILVRRPVSLSFIGAISLLHACAFVFLLYLLVKL
jgi:hypothetical protein